MSYSNKMYSFRIVICPYPQFVTVVVGKIFFGEIQAISCHVRIQITNATTLKSRSVMIAFHSM